MSFLARRDNWQGRIRETRKKWMCRKPHLREKDAFTSLLVMTVSSNTRWHTPLTHSLCPHSALCMQFAPLPYIPSPCSPPSSRSLVSLDLSGTPLGDGHWLAELANYLSASPTLTQLDMSRCNLIGHPITGRHSLATVSGYRTDEMLKTEVRLAGRLSLITRDVM